jgi:hypothetical protein
MSKNYMATRIAVVRHHSASQREELEGLFPVACELIQRALSMVDDDAPKELAQHFRGTFNSAAQTFLDAFKSDAQTFLDATRLISRDASAADRRRQLEG